jgi:DNA-directed RNA polymerase subunit M/transcription elongation factor TFIIS
MAGSNPTPASDAPKYIGVECRVCGTRMYGRPEHIGKKLKCPDCGARTELPAPEPERKGGNTPAAMEGEQYELWDVDAQPLPSEILARQPRYIAIQCDRCDTIFYATEQQVGAMIACPDCGRKHVVPPAAKPKAKRQVLSSDAETPELDPAAAPGERPSYTPRPSNGMAFELEEVATYVRAKRESERTGKPMTIDERGRPILPRWPLITGVLPFLFTAGCPTRWGGLTLGLLIPIGLILDGVPAWTNWQGDAMGAMAAFGGLAETTFGAVCGIIWLAVASNNLIAIVTQSAVGNDRVAEWPPMNFISSMSEMLPVSIALAFAAAPGWMLGKFLGVELSQIGILMGSTALIGFPVVLLSQLAGNSTWELIELKVLGAMVRRPFSMLFFYCQSFCLAAVCILITAPVAERSAYLVLALLPVYMACVFIYARLLGRLGWVLGEAMPR